MPAQQGCWLKSKSCPTARRCWKIRPPPWLLMFRSSPSSALSKTRKRTTLEKKRHTVKAQLVISLLTLTILSVVVGKGQQHDFLVFKDSHLLLHPDALLLADSGYQGMHKHHQKLDPASQKEKRPTSFGRIQGP